MSKCCEVATKARARWCKVNDFKINRGGVAFIQSESETLDHPIIDIPFYIALNWLILFNRSTAYSFKRSGFCIPIKRNRCLGGKWWVSVKCIIVHSWINIRNTNQPLSMQLGMHKRYSKNYSLFIRYFFFDFKDKNSTSFALRKRGASNILALNSIQYKTLKSGMCGWKKGYAIITG